MQDRNRSDIILDNDFRFRNVDHILSHNVIIHRHSSYLEDLRGAKDASRGESDNHLVIRRRFLMVCKSRMAAHPIQVEQIIEVDHERLPPPNCISGFGVAVSTPLPMPKAWLFYPLCGAPR